MGSNIFLILFLIPKLYMNRFLFLHVFLFAALVNVCAQEESEDNTLDSLLCLYNKAKDGSREKMEVGLEIAREHYSTDSTIYYVDQVVALAEKHKRDDIKATALVYYAWAYYYKEDCQLSSQYCLDAIHISELTGDKKTQGNAYKFLGHVNGSTNNYELADSCYRYAYRLFEKLGERDNMTECLRGIGQTYMSQRMYTEARKVFERAMEIDSVDHRLGDVADGYISLGDIEMTLFQEGHSNPSIKHLLGAKEYYKAANKLRQTHSNNYSKYISDTKLVHAMFHESMLYGYTGARLKAVVDTIAMLIKDSEEIGVSFGFAEEEEREILHCKAQLLILNGEMKQARFLLDSLMSDMGISDTIAYDDGPAYESLAESCCYTFDDYYQKTGDYKKAYYYRSLGYEIAREDTRVDMAVRLSQQMAQDEFDKKMRLQKEHEQIAILVIVAVLLVLAIVIYEYIRKRKHNRALSMQKEEILQQKEELQVQSEVLELKNKEITAINTQLTDSINYARVIQESLLPKKDMLVEMFDEYFVIYRPLEIVAGDFYWANAVGKYNVLVCADCTGHGVPGALLSMLGVSLLNEVTPYVEKCGSAAVLLDMLRTKLIKSLGQSLDDKDIYKSSNMDGMDLAMIVVDTESNTLHYAGANRPLLLMRDGKMMKVKGDKMPIGIYLGKETSFTDNVMEVKKGDVLYVFSDGMPDQFGYLDALHKEYKHFTTKRMSEKLVETQNMPLPQQKRVLEAAFDEWRNGYEQIDDVLLIGVKI